MRVHVAPLSVCKESIEEMSRRLVNLTPKRFAGSDVTEPFSTSASQQKSHSSPLISVCLIVLGVVLLLCYAFSGSVYHHEKFNRYGLPYQVKDSDYEIANGQEEDWSSRPECRSVACQAIPFLQEVYGDLLNQILHIGPGTCGVVLKLVKEMKLEAWGLQPFDLKPPVHSFCQGIIRKGLVRVAEVYRPIQYRSRSFRLVLVTDTLETLTSKQLNTTLPELARVSRDGFVLFIHSKVARTIPESLGAKARISKPPKPRNKSWWQRRFQMLGLQENEEMTQSFERLRFEHSFKPDYYVFHLRSSDSAGDSSPEDISLDGKNDEEGN